MSEREACHCRFRIAQARIRVRTATHRRNPARLRAYERGIGLAKHGDMRSLLAVVVVAGCGSSSNDVPDDQELHDLSTETSTTWHLRYGGKHVPLADVPQLARTIGLPGRGALDLSVDVTTPKVDGIRDFAKATGTMALSCQDCQLGDDKTKLRIGARDGFLGDGIELGHLTVDRLDAKVSIRDGKLTLTSWKLASPDVEIDVSLDIQLASSVEDSVVDGCIRFKPSKQLEARDPKLYSLLTITGASLGGDGRYHIKLEGTVDKIKRLAKDCGT